MRRFVLIAAVLALLLVGVAPVAGAGSGGGVTTAVVQPYEAPGNPQFTYLKVLPSGIVQMWTYEPWEGGLAYMILWKPADRYASFEPGDCDSPPGGLWVPYAPWSTWMTADAYWSCVTYVDVPAVQKKVEKALG